MPSEKFLGQRVITPSHIAQNGIDKDQAHHEGLFTAAFHQLTVGTANGATDASGAIAPVTFTSTGVRNQYTDTRHNPRVQANAFSITTTGTYLVDVDMNVAVDAGDTSGSRTIIAHVTTGSSGDSAWYQKGWFQNPDDAPTDSSYGYWQGAGTIPHASGLVATSISMSFPATFTAGDYVTVGTVADYTSLSAMDKAFTGLNVRGNITLRYMNDAANSSFDA